MIFTPGEITSIIAETLTESAKDIMNLEDRRPIVSLAAKTMFAVIEQMSGVERQDSQIKSRDVMVLACSQAAIQKLEKLSKEVQ